MARHMACRVARPTLAALAAAALVLSGPVHSALGTLSNSLSAGSNTVTAGQIFSGARTTTAWSVSDRSSGTAGNVSDVISFAGDSRTKTTGAWAATFASTRYFQVNILPVLAPEVEITSATFNLNFRPSAASSTACFYFEVRAASTGTVLAAYGSAASPVACNSTTTLSAVATSIPILTSTTQANDLAIRIYMKNSGTTKTVVIDQATVSGATAYQSFTLYEKQYVDASTGTATTTNWSLATNDATVYTSTAAWATTFSTTRYIGLTFPAHVPSSATVTAASLERVYRTAVAGDTVCWYMDVLNGATVIGTHGSSGAPISCSSSNTTFTNDTVDLGEINTAALANNTVINLYNRSSSANKSVDTQDLLSVTWSRP